MRRLRFVPVLLLLLIQPGGLGNAEPKKDRQAQLDRFTKLRDTYEAKVADNVKWLVSQHVEFGKWCGKFGLAEEYAAARKSAVELDPSVADALPPLPAGARDDKVARELTAKRRAIAQGLTKHYIDLANWCKKSGMELEFRKTVKKLVRIVPNNPDVRKFMNQQKYENEWLTFEQIQKKKGLKFYRRKWLAEPEYTKVRQADTEKERLSLCKQYGLEFRATYTPYLDVYYTVADDAIKKDLPILDAFFEWVNPGIFLGEFKQPFRFIYVKGIEQFQKIGQRPDALGTYGNGTLHAYERDSPGIYTFVHELTHGMVDISFNSGVPAWFNEGLAAFFESFKWYDNKDGSIRFEVGYINYRMPVYLDAIKAGTAQTLRAFTARTDSTATKYDYSHGRAMFCYLWSQGLLDAYLLRLQLEAGKKSIPDLLEEVLLLPIEQIDEEIIKFCQANPKDWELIKPKAVADDVTDAKVRFEDYATWAGQ